jgi:hypothetical protein
VASTVNVKDAIGERITVAKIIKQPSVQTGNCLQGLLDFFDSLMCAGRHSGAILPVQREQGQ